MNRRRFLGEAVAAGVGTAAAFAVSPAFGRGTMKIELPALPYGESDLAPHISSQTVSIHYGRHHNAYIENTLKLVAGDVNSMSSVNAQTRASSLFGLSSPGSPANSHISSSISGNAPT